MFSPIMCILAKSWHAKSALFQFSTSTTIEISLVIDFPLPIKVPFNQKISHQLSRNNTVSMKISVYITELIYLTVSNFTSVCSRFHDWVHPSHFSVLSWDYLLMQCQRGTEWGKAYLCIIEFETTILQYLPLSSWMHPHS